MARSTVAVRFTGDVNNLKRSIGDVEGRMKGLGSRAGKFGKVLAVGLGGAAVGAVALGKSFVDAAVESQKVTKQTEAVLKSMGGAAGVTADEVADLSEKLSMQTGIDDELIQSGQNVLLTFGKVRNEVGKGNDIFDRATKSALDMSVALGTDMQGATIQVGKALNDPLKGITALSRAGVSFTQKQKDTIKSLVDQGKTLDAQKIILKELENQFGGSAEAQATAGEKLKVVWGNLQEELGARLLPVVEKVAKFLADNLPKAFDAVSRVVGPAMKQISMFWNTLTSGFTEDEGTPIELFALKVRDALSKVAAFVQQWWPQVVAGFEQIVAAVQQHWPEIQRIIQQAVTTIQQVVAGVLSVVQTLWQNFGDNILTFVQRVWPSIQQTISGALEIIRGVIKTVTSLIKGDWSGVWEGIKQIVHGAFNFIVGRIKMALEVARLAVGAAMEVIGAMFKGAWEGIINFFKGVPGKISRIASGMWDGIKNAFKSAINWIIRAWNNLEFKIPGFDPPGPGPKFGGFTLGVPNIPTLHSGTPYFRPADGKREGYALLERGEAITPASQNGTMVFQVVLDGKVLAEAVRRHDRALR